MIATSLMPLSFIMAGPLVDQLFEPLMHENGALANSAGQIIGVGDGRGMALIFVIIGIVLALNAIISYLNPRVRNIEDEIPDALDQRGEVL